MPLYAYACLADHTAEAFEHHRDDRGCRTMLCAVCGQSMGPILSVGRGLTWFEEGRARTLWNLGPDPVVVTGHEQHKRLMRERGLEWVPPKRGMPGCW